MKQFDLPNCQCLNCHKNVDCGAGAQMPSPGDVTVCFYCGHIMAFDKTMLLRELTSEEMYAVAGNEVILSIQRFREFAKDKLSSGEN